MSFPAIRWSTQQDLPAMQKIVLLMIANRINTDSGTCFPSLDTLAKDCGMTRRSVINQVAKLEIAGLLHVERSTEDGVKQQNTYRLLLSASERPSLVMMNVVHGSSETKVPEVVNELHINQNNITCYLTTTTTAQPVTPTPKALSEQTKSDCSRGSSNRNDEKKSDVNTALIFPAVFCRNEQQSAQHLLQSVAKQDHQLILDVLSAAIQANEIRKSSLACLRGIIKHYHARDFDPSPGDRIRSRREQQARNPHCTTQAKVVDHAKVMAELTLLSKARSEQKNQPPLPISQTKSLKHLKPLHALLSTTSNAS